MESNIYCPYIVINRLHVAMSCYEAIKRLRQICRCYMAKSEFPRFADDASHFQRSTTYARGNNLLACQISLSLPYSSGSLFFQMPLRKLLDFCSPKHGFFAFSRVMDTRYTYSRLWPMTTLYCVYAPVSTMKTLFLCPHTLDLLSLMSLLAASLRMLHFSKLPTVYFGILIWCVTFSATSSIQSTTGYN